MNSAAAKNQIDRLRGWRSTRPRDVSLAAELKAVSDHARRADRSLIKLLDAWKSCVPADLAAACQPVAVRAGTADIACDSSAAAYELNRWLQAEGLRALAEAGLPILRVRLVGSPSRCTTASRTKPAGTSTHGARRARP